jgi:hypothetical protein
MRSSGRDGDLRGYRGAIAIVADGFYRAFFDGLLAELDVFGIGGLAGNERIAAFRVAIKKIRGCLPAEVTIDALRVGIKLARYVVLVTIRNPRHALSPGKKSCIIPTLLES